MLRRARPAWPAATRTCGPTRSPSFALGDYEWMLAFEADELHRIVDLMRDLRATEARRHVREEVPFYTGRAPRRWPSWSPPALTLGRRTAGCDGRTRVQEGTADQSERPSRSDHRAQSGAGRPRDPGRIVRGPARTRSGWRWTLQLALDVAAGAGVHGRSQPRPSCRRRLAGGAGAHVTIEHDSAPRTTRLPVTPAGVTARRLGLTAAFDAPAPARSGLGARAARSTNTSNKQPRPASAGSRTRSRHSRRCFTPASSARAASAGAGVRERPS